MVALKSLDDDLVAEGLARRRSVRPRSCRWAGRDATSRLTLPSASRRAARLARSSSRRAMRLWLRVRRASTPLRIQTSSCASSLSALALMHRFLRQLLFLLHQVLARSCRGRSAACRGPARRCGWRRGPGSVRSWVMVTTLPLKSTSRSSSHSIESRSRWLVGSSSSSTSGCGHQRLRQRHALFGAARQRADDGVAGPGAGGAGFPRRAAPSSSRRSASICDCSASRSPVGARQILLDQTAITVARPALAATKTVASRVQHGLLRHIGDAQVLLHLQRAVVGLFQAAQDFEQRGFARAVAADQADAFRGFEGEVGVIEQRRRGQRPVGRREG